MRLVLADVSHGFGPRTVLDAVSLTISPGQAVAITGPSGSGKSTLLGICGGYIRPREGSAYVVHDDGTSTPTRGSAAYVLQTMNTLATRTALDNVALGALQTGSSWADARASAHDALERVGLHSRARQRVRELSGGEVQRVVIARALVGRRPFVLADEPTGQLDRASTLSVVERLLESCHDRGLVIVTHDAEVAARCDTRYEIADGTLVTR